ncbi:MAG: glycosyltransferase, partial [Thermoprotei archaeon]
VFLKSLECAINSEELNKEVILVDNGSTDGSLEFVSQRFGPKLKLVGLGENRGHAAGMNAGAAACSSDVEFLVFANNDVTYPAKLVSAIVEYMDRNPRIGVAGCMEIIPGRPTNFCGSCYDLRLYNVAPKCGGQPCLVTTVENLITVRGDVFRSLGGFDSELTNVFDEQELCIRVWMSGYQVVCIPNLSFVHVHTYPNKDTPARWILDLRNKYIAMLKLYSLNTLPTLLFPRIVKDLYKALSDKDWRENNMFYHILVHLLKLVRLLPVIVEFRLRYSSLKKYSEKYLFKIGVFRDVW